MMDYLASSVLAFVQMELRLWQESIKTFLARVLQVAHLINFAHCIIHRENLACKTLDPDLKSVLAAAIKIVNFIKSRPLQTRLFTIL